MKAATCVPITATIASTGALTPARAILSLPIPAVTVPIVVIVLPIITNKGPIAATTAPIVTIVFF